MANCTHLCNKLVECYGRNERKNVSKVFSLKEFMRSCKNRKTTQAQCCR